MIYSNSTIVDRSVTLTGSAQAAAVAANPYRNFLMIQAPVANACTFSFTNPTPAAGATGCITLAANSAPLFFTMVPNGPINIIGTNTQVAIILEGSP